MKQISLIFILFLFFYCQKETSKNNTKQEKPAKYCWQERALFEPTGSTPVVALDFAKPNSVNLEIMKKALKTADCEGAFDIGIKLSNARKVSTTLRLWCEDIIYCGINGRPRSKILLFLNGRHYLDIPDTVGKSVVKRLQNTLLSSVNSNTNNELYFSGVSLEWEIGVSREKIEKAFDVIIYSYLSTYKELSKKYFKKLNLCDLTIVEVLFLKRKLPFKIYLWNWGYHPEISPPPVIADVKESK